MASRRGPVPSRTGPVPSGARLLTPGARRLAPRTPGWVWHTADHTTSTPFRRPGALHGGQSVERNGPRGISAEGVSGVGKSQTHFGHVSPPLERDGPSFCCSSGRGMSQGQPQLTRRSMSRSRGGCSWRRQKDPRCFGLLQPPSRSLPLLYLTSELTSASQPTDPRLGDVGLHLYDGLVLRGRSVCDCGHCSQKSKKKKGHGASPQRAPSRPR